MITDEMVRAAAASDWIFDGHSSYHSAGARDRERYEKRARLALEAAMKILGEGE